MRKTSSGSYRLLPARFLFLLALAMPQLPAQQPAATPAAMPSDPKQLMQLAAQLNGLTGDSVPPWHLKVAYTLYDPSGTSTGQGAYDEFWLNPTKFKRIIVQGAFTQTDFGTASGLVRSGSQQPPSPFIDQMRQSFTQPLPNAKLVAQSQFDTAEREANGEKLTCLQFAALTNPDGRLYCFGSGEPALRAFVLGSAPFSLEVDGSRILTFNGHYVPGDLTIFRAGKPLLTAHVEAIEPIDSPSLADFTPPPDAAPVRRTISISAGVAVGLLVKKTPPEYPLYAKQQGIQGTVVLQARIGKDGKINDLHIVSGPDALRDAALDAVRRWQYRPYLLNGEPVEVNTTINVIFTLGNHPDGPGSY